MPPKKPKLTWPGGLYRIAGHSMQPTFQPGDTLLGWRWWYPRRLGQVVVAVQADQLIIKRITGRTPDGRLILAGDNPADSRDSRHFGPVGPAQIQAVIICKLP